MDIEEPNANVQASSSFWCATIEMFCHQVLKVRRLYPKESFCTTRFLGVQCYANRHPRVVKYISDTAKMATASLLEGTSKEVSVVVFDSVNQRRHEKFSLAFPKTPLKAATLATASTPQERERDARDFILSILRLEGMPTKKWSPSITFRIELFVPEEVSTSKLHTQISDGKWFCADRQATPRSEERRRPIFHMAASAANFYYQELVDAPPDES